MNQQQTIEQQINQQYVVSGRLVQAIGDYLITRPYNEVYQLVQGLGQVKPIGNTPQEFLQNLGAMIPEDNKKDPVEPQEQQED